MGDTNIGAIMPMAVIKDGNRNCFAEPQLLRI